MKKILLILTLLISASALTAIEAKKTTNAEYKANTNEVVYVCTGKSSKRYHKNSDCRGLAKCSGTIESVSVSTAKNSGKTPCKICNK